MPDLHIPSYNKAITDVLHTLDMALSILPDHRGTIQVVREGLEGLLLNETEKADAPRPSIPDYYR